MLNLLVKDFKLLFNSKENTKKRIFSLIFSILMYGAFIIIETFLFVMIINKVKKYPEATPTFLVLFLFIISCIMIVLNIFRANKLFFNESDVEQLTRHPVTNEQIIFSKLIFLLGMHYFTSFIFVYPLFLAYGQILGATPWFYFICIFYPLLSFLFEGGVALLFVYPIKLVIDYLKKHIVIQFVSALVVMVGFCIVYSYVLEIFMDLVVSNNLNSLFTTQSIESLQRVTEYMMPINFLSRMYLGQRNDFLPFILISLGVLMIGVTVSIFAFHYFRSIRFVSKPKESKTDLKSYSVNKILIKKELTLLFKDSNNIFSYTGLLMVQPFLMYLVVDALNGVFLSGTFAYYILVVPEFIPLLDIVLIMLFTLIINSGANNYITVEKKTIKIMKTIPVSYTKQLLFKVLVPLVASLISLLVSTVVLVSFGVISFQTFIFGTLLTLVLLIEFEIISLKEELNIRMNKPRNSFLSSLYSYLLPIAFFVVVLLVSAVGVPTIVSYLMGLIVIVGLGIPFIINLKSKTANLFMDLEAVN